MRKTLVILAGLVMLWSIPVLAGDADIKAGQATIANQIEAFLAGDNDKAYSYAAPNIKRTFPTVDGFMSMVTRGYPPVYQPQNYAFGKSEEMGGGTIAQQVLVTGPDGKSYEAMYMLERQPDGSYLIKGVSLRASNALSA